MQTPAIWSKFPENTGVKSTSIEFKPTVVYYIMNGDLCILVPMVLTKKLQTLMNDCIVIWKSCFFRIHSSYTVLLRCRGFHFSLDLTQSVGLLGRVISPSQDLCLNTGQHKQRKIHTDTPNIHVRSMYVYSRGGPHTALAPRISLIYCASRPK
jgi:hypothetical protein